MFSSSLMKWLRPEEEACFDVFDQAALNVQFSARALDEALHLANLEANEAFLRIMKEQVAQALDLNLEIVDLMHHAMVTPLDQEDILALAHALKAVVDRIRAISERLVRYHMDVVPSEAWEMSGVLLGAAEELVLLIALLRDRKNYPRMAIHIQRVRTLGNEADEVFRRGLTRIFAELSDPIELIKQKELLEQIEDASGRIEKVAKAVGLAIQRNG